MEEQKIIDKYNSLCKQLHDLNIKQANFWKENGALYHYCEEMDSHYLLWSDMIMQNLYLDNFQKILNLKLEADKVEEQMDDMEIEYIDLELNNPYAKDYEIINKEFMASWYRYERGPMKPQFVSAWNKKMEQNKLTDQEIWPFKYDKDGKLLPKYQNHKDNKKE